MADKVDKRQKPIEVRQDGDLIGVFPSMRVAARLFALDEKKISLCVRGLQKTCHGYTFRRFSRSLYGGKD